jgi:hypothetical protein
MFRGLCRYKQPYSKRYCWVETHNCASLLNKVSSDEKIAPIVMDTASPKGRCRRNEKRDRCSKKSIRLASKKYVCIDLLCLVKIQNTD